MGGDPLSNIASPPRLEERERKHDTKDRLIKKKGVSLIRRRSDPRTAKEYVIVSKWESAIYPNKKV